MLLKNCENRSGLKKKKCQDNAPAHKCLGNGKTAGFAVDLLGHTPHSPDLADSDEI